MSAALPEFVSHCQELLSPLGAVRARRMFGGWGFYVDDCFVAIVADERLFLKTTEDTRPRFAQQPGCTPFVFEAKGKTQVTSYWSAPDEAMDSPALMAPWARLALQAALTARTAKPALKRRAPPRPRAKPAAKTTKR